jgi:endonuclease/exonuclease/phosphatase family metal-dependent hydrolase
MMRRIFTCSGARYAFLFFALCTVVYGGIGIDGGSENFDSSTDVPAGWINNGTVNDTLSSHYQSPPNCRALGTGDSLETPAVNNPTSLTFYVDASNNGDGETASVDYRISGGSWQQLAEFVVSKDGINESIDLTSSPGLGFTTGVCFRFNSTFNTWYLDDVIIRAGSGLAGPAVSNVTRFPQAPTEQDEVSITANITSLHTLLGQQVAYRVDGGIENTTAMSPVSGSLYAGIIPAQAAGAYVSYRVLAWDAAATNSSETQAYTVRDSSAPVIELLAHAVTPTSGQEVVIYSAVRSVDAAVTNTAVWYSSDNWGTAHAIPATLSEGSVYTADAIPGFSSGTDVEYTAVAVNNAGIRGYGPTNAYTVQLPGSGGASYTCRVMAANISDGQSQIYDATGVRIFQGLVPDIVAIQEFNYTGLNGSGAGDLVEDAFGTNFYYVNGNGSIPNGVISRWPITAWGEWPSPVANRDFTWATIDIPGPEDMHVVSVHLPTSNAGDRNTEAYMIKTNVTATFSATDYIIVAGDMNTDSRTEAAIDTFKTFLSDDQVPSDQAGVEETNNSRSKPYDYVLPNESLDSEHITTALEGRSFSEGLVYDSRVTSPYTFLPGSIQANDSSAHQHMGVVKDYLLTGDGAADNGPVLEPVSHQTVPADIPLILTVIAYDTDNDYVTLLSSDPLHFSPVSGYGAVTGTYSWTPGPADMGNHAVQFTAASGDLSSSQIINIAVVPEPAILAIIIPALLALLKRQADPLRPGSTGVVECWSNASKLPGKQQSR